MNEDAINLDCNLLAMSSTEVLRASCAPLSAQRRAQQSPWGPMARVRTAPLAHTTRLADGACILVDEICGINLHRPRCRNGRNGFAITVG